jgi:hypothetical protein
MNISQENRSRAAIRFSLQLLTNTPWCQSVCKPRALSVLPPPCAYVPHTITGQYSRLKEEQNTQGSISCSFSRSLIFCIGFMSWSTSRTFDVSKKGNITRTSVLQKTLSVPRRCRHRWREKLLDLKGC